MRIWLVTVIGLALASVLLTRLGDMMWSPGMWPRFGVWMAIGKVNTALIATGPVAVLLGFWAVRLAPLKERRALWLGALCGAAGFAAFQLGELRGSGVHWGGKVPPMPALAMYLPYVALLGGFLAIELSRIRNHGRLARQSVSSAAHSEAGNHSRRSES